MEIEKSKIEVYYLRKIGDCGWADISLDEGEKSGRISISSDWGNWANYWGACGENFKKFLCGLNMEYFACKVGQDKWLDFDKTIETWKSKVLEYRREDEIDQETARNIFDELKELQESCDSATLVHEAYNKSEFMKLFDYCPDTVTSVNPSFRAFWNKAYLPFIEHLKAEMPKNVIIEKQFA